jgi:transcription elongation factor Elf1
MCVHYIIIWYIEFMKNNQLNSNIPCPHCNRGKLVYYNSNVIDISFGKIKRTFKCISCGLKFLISGK